MTVTYKVYLNKDRKPVVRAAVRRPAAARRWLLAACFPLLVASLFLALQPEATIPPAIGITDGVAVAPIEAPLAPVQAPLPPVKKYPPIAAGLVAISEPGQSGPEVILPEPPPWHEIKIKKGDSLSLIFARYRLSHTDLHAITSLNRDTRRLRWLLPGQKLSFTRLDGKLQQLKYEPDFTTSLIISRVGNKFTSELQITELTTLVKQAKGVIHESLFIAGQRAGLTDKLIMELADIYGWDIDFVLDIRKGDSFMVVYEEKYKDDTKVHDGPILAAEFVNRGKRVRAIRYRNKAGRYDYYTPEGMSLRKTFLRAPLDFTRISSRFSLGRRHPVLNTIRAHKGVDYAAPTGTPIRATADGIVHLAGRKGGYGRTIILRHGGNYSTLYAHLSRYRKGLRRGKQVLQGQIIGYVGRSGLATGPHLHYEFRFNGKHRNPLTVKLPRANSVAAAEMQSFRQAGADLLPLLDAQRTGYVRTEKQDDPELFALREK
ncbi:MAG: OapA family protein [Gammaproteobacteria bacterium]